jgi:hypothetical protein
LFDGRRLRRLPPHERNSGNVHQALILSSREAASVEGRARAYVPLSGQPFSFAFFFMLATPTLISFSNAFMSTSSSLLM